ncbi:MAG: cyclic nucleotide-binding domain-containing protein [Alphaproteobacteria bacterium]|nr:cyclic nucleotide-binding domain-containing protein [Alphaproteobacteria bacterium]
MAGPLNLEQLITFLLDAPMFGDLDPVELSEVVHIMQVQHLREGQVVFEEGAPGDAWYVVYEGRVEVVVDTGDDDRILVTYGLRSCFGEMAILDGSPRSATVRAASDGTVLKFPRLSFQVLLDEGNLAAFKLVMQMAKVLAARQRDSTMRIVEMLRRPTDADVRRRLAPIVEAASRSE